jgi:2-polyprenyl-3-methyl-5-hydroxy-6-metoxy-1,4-benzoquinol methylase
VAKPAVYYRDERADLVGLLPHPLGSVLDVGCGGGANGPGLKAAGAERLTGIEPVSDAGESARESYDEVLLGTVEEHLPKLTGPFDTILCWDVLEHLVDPWAVLRDLRAIASEGGRLQVSLPNARHVSLFYDLIVRGTFGYRELGHRDNTHLRWFTRRDIEEAVEGAGWVLNSTRRDAGRRAIGKLGRRIAPEFFTVQWHLLATAESPS